MLDIVAVGQYQLKYESLGEGIYPSLWKNGEMVFSGWVCKTIEDAQTLLISTYWQSVGELEPGYQAIDYRLIAAHPLNRLLLKEKSDSEGNVAEIKKSIELNGNMTNLFPIGCSSDGITASGHSRIKAFARINQEAIARGEEPPHPLLYVVVQESEADDRKALLVGNKYRRPSDLTILAQAELQAALEEDGDKGYRTRVRDLFMAAGRSGGAIYGAATAVKKYLESCKDEDMKEAIADIAENNSALIAQEIIDLGDSSKAKKMEKQYPAFDSAKVSPELPKQVAMVKRTGEKSSPAKIATEIINIDSDLREVAIARKVQGDTRTLTAIAQELKSEGTDRPTSASSTKQIFDEYHNLGIKPDDCWDTNQPTSSAMVEVVGGKVDCDPFASMEGFKAIPANWYITAREDALKMEWARIVVTNFPFSIQSKCFNKMCEQIQSGIVEIACFISSADLLFSDEGQKWADIIPFAYCLTKRVGKNNFGFTPSGYLLDAYPSISTDSRRGNCIIWYFGPDMERFADIISRFGEIGYNQKAMQQRLHEQLHPAWEPTDTGAKTVFFGRTIQIDEDSENLWSITIDGDTKDSLFTSKRDAAAYAIAFCVTPPF